MGRPVPDQYRVPVRESSEYAIIDAERMTVQIGDKLFEKPRYTHPRILFNPMTRARFWRILSKGDPAYVNVTSDDSVLIELGNRHRYGNLIRLFLVEPKQQTRA